MTVLACFRGQFAKINGTTARFIGAGLSGPNCLMAKKANPYHPASPKMANLTCDPTCRTDREIRLKQFVKVFFPNPEVSFLPPLGQMSVRGLPVCSSFVAERWNHKKCASCMHWQQEHSPPPPQEEEEEARGRGEQEQRQRKQEHPQARKRRELEMQARTQQEQEERVRQEEEEEKEEARRRGEQEEQEEEARKRRELEKQARMQQEEEERVRQEEEEEEEARRRGEQEERQRQEEEARKRRQQQEQAGQSMSMEQMKAFLTAHNVDIR
eukprot:g4662.t1